MTNTTAAWTWGQTVATTGTGPTATVEIDVRVPGHGEPEPVVVPLADARVLHAMLGDAIREVGEGGDAAAAAGLTTTERDMLRYALELAQDQIHSRGGEFDDDDQAAVDKLRRMADEAQQPETGTLAAALDGIHGLIATSSRDWGTYRVDAWLWAVLCGWDCEQDEHDETCTHGAMEEMAALHGWDDDTVAKARRYRAAVRAVIESVATQPGKEA